MIRSFKILGLALAAIFALGAVTSSTASAAPKLTPAPEEYPLTLKGSQEGTNELESEGSRLIQCTTATLEGTIANKAEAEESKVTVTPTYSGCTATILGTKDLTTITMNGCAYLQTDTETTAGTIKSEGWTVTGDEKIKCPAGKEIEIHVFASEAKDKENAPLCTYKIAEQTPTGSIDYKLTEKNAEEHGTHGAGKWTISGIATTKTIGTVTNCGAASQNWVQRGTVKLEGFNALGVMLRLNFQD